MSTKILVIEDDQRVADLIKRSLEEFNYDVTLSYDGNSGFALAHSKQFSLIITDIILPGMSGLDLCKKLKEAHPDQPIIMLTALGTTDDKVEGFDAGADDYMVKPFEIRELIARIRALLKRSSTNNNGEEFILKIADLEMNLHTKIVKRGNIEINLTPKEFDLLAYMLANRERVLSKSEIAEKVWDTRFDTGTNFIEVYISYLRRKIDKNFTEKLIHTKSGMGFILKSENENPN